jgi:hypothetical protein
MSGRFRRKFLASITSEAVTEPTLSSVQFRKYWPHRILTPNPSYLSISGMGSLGYERDRRSSRVFMRVRVVVSGKSKLNRKFRETCETVVINAHGGLLYTKQSVEMGALLVVTNPFTQEDQECRVVYLGDETDSEKGQRIGIEFLTPAPHFWGVEFAQPDWISTKPQTPVAQN